MKKISIDLGYGYIKATSNFTKKQILFPSIIKKTGKSKDNLLQNALGRPDKDYLVEYNNKVYFVGKLGLDQFGERHFSQNGQYQEERINVLINTAVHQIINQSEEKIENIELYVGVSLGTYIEGKKKLKEISDKIDRKINTTINNKNIQTKIKKLAFRPQGIGAYVNLSKEGSIDDEDTVGIIDYGFRTVEIIVVRRKNIVESMTFSFDEHGANYIFETATEKIKEKLGKAPSIDDLENLYLRNRKYKNISVKSIVEKVSNNYGNNLISNIQKNWGSNIEKIDYIVPVGGGSKLIKDSIEKAFSNVRYTENQQTANASGFLLM